MAVEKELDQHSFFPPPFPLANSPAPLTLFNQHLTPGAPGRVRLDPFPILPFFFPHGHEPTNVGPSVAVFERRLLGGGAREVLRDERGGLGEGARVSSTVPCAARRGASEPNVAEEAGRQTGERTDFATEDAESVTL